MRKGAIRTMRWGGALLLMTMGMVGVWGSLGASTAGAAGTGATPTEAKMATQILTYTNEDRAARGYQTLQTSQYLMDMAQAYVEQQSTPNQPNGDGDPTGNRWDDPSGTWDAAYLNSHPCSGVCPFITYSPPTGKNGSSSAEADGSTGRQTSSTFVLSWRTSPPHWDNLMASGWTMAGVGMDCATGFSDFLTASTSSTFVTATQPMSKTPNVVLPHVGTACNSSTTGYRMVAGDGGVFDFGNAQFYGSMGGEPLNEPIVGSAAGPTGGGYWEVAGDGGIFSFGNAQFHGSMGGKPLNKPIVGMAVDPVTGGYWEVASDGGIFSFDAPFHGSMGGKPLNKPIVGMAATSTGGGYWLVASDGGVFSFGNAQFHGSMGGKPLNEPIVAMTTDIATGGYWFTSSTGGVFSFDAPFHGSGTGLATSPVVGMAETASTGGYWVADARGGVFSFDAPFDGSMGGHALNAPMVGFASS